MFGSERSSQTNTQPSRPLATAMHSTNMVFKLTVSCLEMLSPQTLTDVQSAWHLASVVPTQLHCFRSVGQFSSELDHFLGQLLT